MTIITAKRVEGRTTLEISVRSVADVDALLADMYLLADERGKYDRDRGDLWLDATTALEQVRAPR